MPATQLFLASGGIVHREGLYEQGSTASWSWESGEKDTPPTPNPGIF